MIYIYCQRLVGQWLSKTVGPYPRIAPGGYSIHYPNTNPNPYPHDSRLLTMHAYYACAHKTSC